MTSSKRYLKVWADYQSTGLGDEDGRRLSPGDISLPTFLWDELASWVSRYSHIIPLSTDEREKRLSEIRRLDREGIEIARKVAEYLGSEHKVRYYSEGRMMFLDSGMVEKLLPDIRDEFADDK